MEATERSQTVAKVRVIAGSGAPSGDAAVAAPTARTARVEAAEEWAPQYARRVSITDTIAVATAIAVAYVARFPTDDLVGVSGYPDVNYLTVAIALFVAWLLTLAAGRTRDRRIFGSGSNEYARVVDVSWRLFAVVAIVAYLLKMQIGRGFLLLSLPLGIALLLLGRYESRQWLHRERDEGRCRSGLIVVGPRAKAEALVEEFGRNRRASYTVAGVCLPENEFLSGETIAGIPVLGTIADAAHVAVTAHASAIGIAGADAVTGTFVRQLGWDLEGTGIDLALTLALVDVAGPRVLMQPVSGLPLVYVDEPRFTGWRFVAKSAGDWIGATLLTVLLSPVLLTVAALVKATSPGPVIYRQERIGKDGRPFSMFKFRSMHVGAHERLAEVLAAEGVAAVGAFYKPKNDPRVTKVGRVLRKYSLDELPQLFNVITGTMSLVGPRPQIADEVAGYDRAAHRRLRVKPGLTGLWQVSGRSSLDPGQAMRLDVQYVENWSVAGDLLILLRTLHTVVATDSAR